MKTTRKLFSLKTSAALVQTALAALASHGIAHAADSTDEDPALAALIRPTSSVEIGLGSVSAASYKFGEYNGLQEKGAFPVVDMDIAMRSAHDGDGTSHFRLRAGKLGLDVRNLSLDYGMQGKFRLNLGYDELRRNISDSYQTPFLGAGTSSLTLPSNWVKPVVPQVGAGHNFRVLSEAIGDAASLTGAPSAAQRIQIRNIQAADLPAFHDVNLHTKRRRYDAGFSLSLGPAWELTGSFKHEEKEGTKALGALNAFGGGDSVVILPELIDTTTQQYNIAVNYSADNYFGQLAYYGSVFDNHVQSMTWQDPKDKTLSPSISTAPSNQFHEINFTGGYNFSPKTKLVVNGAYGRNTQNELFLTPSAFNPAAFSAPATSADALVITKSLGMKLTAKPSAGWNIASSFKHNQRDNQTPVRAYTFYDGDALSNTSPAAPPLFSAFTGGVVLGQNGNYYNNRPLSKTVNQFRFDSDVKVASGHTLAGGIEWEKIDRKCEGTWIACSDADHTDEKSLKAEWRAELSQDISTKVAYSHSRRTVNYNENAWLAEVPLAQYVGGPSTPGGAAPTLSVHDFLTLYGLTGFGPLLGFPTVPLTGNAAILTPNNNIVLLRYYGSRNNVSEIPGMRRFNLADRNRDKLRTSVDWQATEQLSLQAGLDYKDDTYSRSVYGLTMAKDLAVNLDGTYVLGQNLSAIGFFSHENQRSGMRSTPANISNTNPATAPPAGNNVLAASPCYTSLQAQNGVAKIDPCNQWSATTRDNANTLGFGLNKKKMLGGKFDLDANVVFTRARSNIDVSGGTYVNNPLASTAGQPGRFYIAAENYPTVTTSIFELRLQGEYRFDKTSSLKLGYSFQRLKSSADYAYEGLQTGTLNVVLPTNERVARYTVHSIGAAYVYRFQ